MSFYNILKIILKSDIEYDPSDNSDIYISFPVGADILNLLFLYELFMFFHVLVNTYI